MNERVISARTYVVVCALLILLTVLTVAVSFAPLAAPGHTAIGLAIAVCKGSLVVLFFMHALKSPRLTWLVILVSAFWLALLFVLIMNDYTTRGQVPFMPGH